MSKPKKPHDPSYAKPGTPPPSPEQVDRMVAEFKLRMLEFDLRASLARVRAALDSLAKGGKS